MYISKMTLVQIVIFFIVALFAILAFYSVQPVNSTKEFKKEKPPEAVSKINPTFNVDVDPTKSFSIGFFGETRGDVTKGDVFDKSVLQGLLEVLSKQQAKAIFLTGNLVAAEIYSPHKDENSTNQQEIFPADSATLQKQLKEFFDSATSYAPHIPLFAIPGDHEVRVGESAKLFQDQFNLINAEKIGDSFFGYTVGIGNAFFAVIQTDVLDAKTGKVKSSFPPALTEWLKKQLASAAKSYKYLFVVGHEPAYPLTSTLYKQPENEIQERDLFWKTLVEANVLAYFSSHEHLFDRSNRSGVWQIISGGGGAPFNADEKETPFYHTLLLVISPNKDTVPVIKVFDTSGQVISEFDLIQNHSPLYQVHIS